MLRTAHSPGDQAIDEQASDACLAAFADYVGTAYDDSELDYLYVGPDAETWDLGDRQIVCGR